TWGPGAFEPGGSAFWDAVAEVRPDLVRAFNPWDLVVTPDQLVDLYASAGIAGATAVAEHGERAMRGAEDWWAVMLGTGTRGSVDVLSPSDRAHVERSVRAAMAAGPSVRTPLVLGTARK